jgi:LytS/YehU family sensor histidine kinase
MWGWYAAAWLPMAALYSVIITRQRPMSAGESLISGVGYVLPVALLGVGVWWLSGIVVWPPKSRWRFFVTHAFLVSAFAGLWLFAEVAIIARSAGFARAIQVSKTFALFQTLDAVLFYGILSTGSYLIGAVSRLREQEARAAKAESLRMRAELAALRGQLNPHFLFNTLHTLTALVRRDPETAERALERFGDMLRYVLDVKRSAREDVTLADEMQFVHNYLSLEQLRLADRLEVEERIDPETLDCVLPSLTLQPLVENAIKYGIAPIARGGTLHLSAVFDDESLVLEVRDDGPGAPTNVLDTASGVGLRAVRQRLETRYMKHASFAVTTAPGQGFAVRVRLPAHAGAEVPALSVPT